MLLSMCLGKGAKGGVMALLEWQHVATEMSRKELMQVVGIS